MLLTLISNGNDVYIKPEIVLLVLEIDEVNDVTKETVHFSRIFTKDLVMGEDVPNWIDVKESAETIYNSLRKRK